MSKLAGFCEGHFPVRVENGNGIGKTTMRVFCERRSECPRCIAKLAGELARDNARLREQLLQARKANADNAELGLACVEVLVNHFQEPRQDGAA